MLIRREITADQAMTAMRNGEFGSDIIGAGRFVAVVLTQGWCSQWHYLNAGFARLEAAGEPAQYDIHLFTLVYDEEEYFFEFLRFKETVFGNDIIPYIRYYRDGVFVDDSNYVSPVGLIERLAAR